MKKLFMLILLGIAVIAVVLFTTGCSSQPKAKSETSSAAFTEGTYQKIAAATVKERLGKGEKLIIVDVRTKEEYDGGHIPNSLLIPYDEIEVKAPALLKDKNAAIIVYCRTGRRSEIAAKALIGMGYTNVADMGGINTWTYGLEK